MRPPIPFDKLLSLPTLTEEQRYVVSTKKRIHELAEQCRAMPHGKERQAIERKRRILWSRVNYFQRTHPGTANLLDQVHAA